MVRPANGKLALPLFGRSVNPLSHRSEKRNQSSHAEGADDAARDRGSVPDGSKPHGLHELSRVCPTQSILIVSFHQSEDTANGPLSLIRRVGRQNLRVGLFNLERLRSRSTAIGIVSLQTPTMQYLFLGAKARLVYTDYNRPWDSLWCPLHPS
jgi:hypothetical protein